MNIKISHINADFSQLDEMSKGLRELRELGFGTTEEPDREKAPTIRRYEFQDLSGNCVSARRAKFPTRLNENDMGAGNE